MNTLKLVLSSTSLVWICASACSDGNDGSANQGGAGGKAASGSGGAVAGGGSGNANKGGSTGGGMAGSTASAGEPSSSGAGGATQSGGRSGVSAGAGGVTSGGTSATGGGAGEEAGSAGNGGSAGSGGTAVACGGLGEACCAAQPLCDANLTCLRDASCSCAKEVRGEYVLRVDGIVVHEAQGAQTPVIDPASGRAMTGFIDVMSGSGFGCGVRNNGSLWCWGSSAAGNAYGQLGDGTTGGVVSTYRAKQVLVSANTPLVGVAALAHAPAGGTTACAITTGGNLYCWGDLTWVVAGGASYLYSGYAQAITTNGLTPVANVVHASVTYGGGCALVQGSSSKEVYCWGCNQTNELAQGNTTTSKYPVKVGGLDDPSYIESSLSSSNGNHTNCAIDGGKVRCWGWNPYYSAGGGAAQSVGAPTLIYLPDATTPLAGVTAITSGNETFCALVNNDTIWCWGYRNGAVQYATNYGVTNIVGLGDPELPRFLTSDGKYHIGMASQAVSCGEL